MKTIHLRQFKDGSIKCISISVPEHKSCKCECAKTENDCSQNAVYDPVTCSCNCKEKVTFFFSNYQTPFAN